MDMKLSYRDKVIFIVVMVILVLVAGYFVVVKPKFDNLEKVKYNLETKREELAELEDKIASLPSLIEEVETIANEVGKKQEIFFEENHPYVNETYIRNALKEVGVNIKSMSTNYTVASNIARYTVANKNILAYDNKMNADLYNELPQEVYDKYMGVAGESYPGAVIGVTTMVVTFEYDARLAQVYKVLDKIAEDEKTVILNTINSSVNDESAETDDATINLTMYSIYPLNVDKIIEQMDEMKENIDMTATETPAE